VATCRRPPICVESARQKKANERPHLDLSARSLSQPDHEDHITSRVENKATSVSSSLIDENTHLKNQLLQRDHQIDQLSARLEAMERLFHQQSPPQRAPEHRRSLSPLRIKTSPVSPRALPQPPRQERPQPPRQERPQPPRQERPQSLALARRNDSPIRMPDPPEFDNHKVDFSRWLVKMRLKLDEFDGQSERFKIQYITSRTTDGPFERLHPRRFASADDCLNQLNDWYGERHRESRAWSELSRLYQGPHTSFADFFAQFEQLLAFVPLPESAQIDMLRDKLNLRYVDKVEDGTSYTLRQLIRRCYALDAGFAREDARNNTFYDDYDTDEIQEME
ncbi:hypothetical protein D6D17_10435, partial [Aureobasidium pullulans]